MKAAFFLGDRRLEVRDVPDPTPGPGEVVLEIKASGMCGTDITYYRAQGGAGSIGFAKKSDEPVIAGHEPCGVVCAVGPGVSSPLARVGQRVMSHHYAGCGSCRSCHGGWTQMCDEGATTFGVNGHGSHAEYMAVPADSLSALPDELSFQTGAAISCGTGTAWAALDRLNLRADDTIAIFGQGPVGLSATQLARAFGARVIALDIDEGRLQRAARFGADVTINVQTQEPVEAILEATAGRGAECTIDSAATPSARSAAIRSAAKWGRVVFLGEGGDVTIDVSNDLNRKQLALHGNWTLSKYQLADCARFVAGRKVDVDALFTHSWALEHAAEAYRVFDTRTTGKGVLLPTA